MIFIDMALVTFHTRKLPEITNKKFMWVLQGKCFYKRDTKNIKPFFFTFVLFIHPLY